ncbi:MAG: branched-chain amino acid ABC transporter permease [Anaerolineales bacterium]|nr:MAG: branched-chain amino acid ABC transporter permease [Anaerolineales bacterium]
MNRKWLSLGLVAASVLALIAFGVVLEPYPYWMHIAIVAFFYAILASSWSLLAGYAGQFSFGHMAFMAIGAYTAGIFGKFIRLSTAPTGICSEIPLGNTWLVFLNAIPERGTVTGQNCLELGKAHMPVGTLIYQLPAMPGIVLGIIMGGIFGFLIGLLVLRLRRTYLALFTIGFSEILRTALNAEIDITQGPNGLELAPLFPKGVHLFGYYFSSVNKVPPYYVMLALFLVSMAVMYWLAASRFGLFIRSIREDEEAAAALGVHIVRYKVLVFVVTSMIAAAAGAVQAHYITVITPNILLIMQMSLVIAMAVIGGLESLIGAAIGAIIIEFALELLRTSFTIGPIVVEMTTWRLVFFGLLLMLTLRFWNNGLIHPIIQRLTRVGWAEEAVSRRVAMAEEME